MKKIEVCQSCGVHLDETSYGTNADGSENKEYCSHCLKDGYFTAGFTLEETADYSSLFVDDYNRKHGTLFTRNAFKYVLEAVLAKLKRWTLPADKLPPVATTTSSQQEAIDAVNALNLPDCPKITEMKVVWGKLINEAHNIEGNDLQLFDENTYYWCTRALKTDGSGRRYGFACSENYIVAIEVGRSIEDANMVMIKCRDDI